MDARTGRVVQSLAKRIALAVGVVVILGGVTPVWLAEPTSAGAYPTTPPTIALDARASTRDLALWARTSIPGVRAVYLEGLPPDVARALVETTARVAREYDVAVPVIVPSRAWEAATDSAPLDATLFASP